ncbi:MAG: NAD(P)(+) transhydrogenase (Re/Si-specific) subunit beta [Bacilli bacterium]
MANNFLWLISPPFPSWIYCLICTILVIGVLVGIALMSNVKHAITGNRISAICLLIGIIITFVYHRMLPVWLLYIDIAIGSVIGVWFAVRVKMIQVPQFVALLNGLGGLSSAIVGIFSLYKMGADGSVFSSVAAIVAIIIGSVTFTGSIIAALKLQKVISGKRTILKGHNIYLIACMVAMVLSIVLVFLPSIANNTVLLVISLISASLFGLLFSIRVGGADMPITISLLNSCSGVAAGVAGLATGEVLLVGIGALVGASGLLLTQIMCKAMNRKLCAILLGKGKKNSSDKNVHIDNENDRNHTDENAKKDPINIIKSAKSVIIVPGYGMAIAQAQHLVKELAEWLKDNKATVKYAIHPVAGRMPGHMNVLLCEANVEYEDLYEMKDVNKEFVNTDLTIVVGANDVINSAAKHIEGTPIYGMPILNVDECQNVIIFNYDTKAGYAGVDNPIYSKTDGVYLVLGDAKATIKDILDKLKK